jgi:hypothetical protein
LRPDTMSMRRGRGRCDRGFAMRLIDLTGRKFGRWTDRARPHQARQGALAMPLRMWCAMDRERDQPDAGHEQGAAAVRGAGTIARTARAATASIPSSTTHGCTCAKAAQIRNTMPTRAMAGAASRCVIAGTASRLPYGHGPSPFGPLQPGSYQQQR